MIDYVNNETKNNKISIKNKFTTNLKDICPIVSFSIVKVYDKNSKKLIALADCSNLFDLDS